MKRLIVIFLAAVTLMLFSGDLSAQVGYKCFDRVTPEGSETVMQVIDPFYGDPPTGYTPSGRVWNYPDGGLAWIASAISVGNRGTQVCAVMELNNERCELFSIFDGDPPTPIWSDTSLYNNSDVYMTSSTFSGDLHVVMYQEYAPDVYNRVPKIHCYDSSSTTPIWTWSYELAINSASKVAIDREGTVVAVAVNNSIDGELDLYFLDPADGSELASHSMVSSGVRGFDLSADGSTLYFHEGGTNVHIWDIATNSEIFATSTSGSFDGHCISGDGTKFAFGGFGNVRVWEYNGSWSSWTYSTGSGNYADEMDFSDDGSTLAFGVTQYTPNYGKTEVYMLDIATHTPVAHVVNTSNGAYQDVISGAAISHDGKYCAVARWGDQLNANPEVQILENGVGLVGSIDTRGSAFAVDMSWDGQITVSGCKSVHANVGGNGGDVDCYTLGGEDMDLIGKPSIGDLVEINVYTGANWMYYLVLGTADDPLGFAELPIGTLYLNILPPNITWFFPAMMADPNGLGSVRFTVCNDTRLIGETVYIQSIFTEDGSVLELSEDYLVVTLLP